MNKNQTIILLEQGSKMSHSMFLSDEYIMRHHNSKTHYLDEAGNVIDIKQFWKYRTSHKWDKNWKVFVKK